METKVKKILDILFWVLVGAWYIPIIFAGYGEGLNCGGVLPNGTTIDGFCSGVYFREHWWLILIRTACIAAAIFGLIKIKQNQKYRYLYPYAIFLFISLSIVIKHIGEIRILPLTIVASVLFFAILSLPWWGSKMILKRIEKKIKKSK